MKRVPIILAVFLAVLGCNLTDKFKKSTNSNSSSSSSSTSNGEPVEHATLSPAQSAAIANGSMMTWDQQGIDWTVPANWKKDDARNETFSSGGGGAFMSGNVSVMAPDFPSEISINAMYESAKTSQKTGKYDEVKWLEIDGLRGVEFRESKTERPDDIRRLEWQAYRKYAGQNQLVTLILSTSGAKFPQHQDELYGILYSMKIVH
jgi:hypothetical protein